MMNRTRVLLSVAIVLSVATLATRELSLLPDGRTHLVFFNVDQGDSAMITGPKGTQIVIDGGPDWSTLSETGRFMPFFDRTIDVLVLSHANLDHMASFPEVLRRYRVGIVLLSGYGPLTGKFGEFITTAKEQGIPVRALHAGQSLTTKDGLTLTILWPPEHLPKTFTTDLNDSSLVVRVSDGVHSALFTGDMKKRVEDTLVAGKADLRSDILKVPHHGSKTSSSTGFLLTVHPSLAVISVGKGNTFGHPNAGVMDRLRKIGAEIRRTDDEGTIEIVWEK